MRPAASAQGSVSTRAWWCVSEVEVDIAVAVDFGTLTPFAKGLKPMLHDRGEGGLSD